MKKEGDDFIKYFMHLINSFEGQVDLLLHTPIASLSLEFDKIGQLTLVKLITLSH